MFNGMLRELDERITTILAQMELQLTNPSEIGQPSNTETFEISQDPTYAGAYGGNESQNMEENKIVTSPIVLRESADVIDPNDPSTWGKVGRNAACPCGSGKKYKHCHGAL